MSGLLLHFLLLLFSSSCLFYSGQRRCLTVYKELLTLWSLFSSKERAKSEEKQSLGDEEKYVEQYTVLTILHKLVQRKYSSQSEEAPSVRAETKAC